jgi:hypothetical protein
MSTETVYLKIKKKYAADILKDLEKIDAIELLDSPPIPDWQKKEVRRRLKELKKNPSKNIAWSEGLKKIKQLSE